MKNGRPTKPRLGVAIAALLCLLVFFTSALVVVNNGVDSRIPDDGALADNSPHISRGQICLVAHLQNFAHRCDKALDGKQGRTSSLIGFTNGDLLRVTPILQSCSQYQLSNLASFLGSLNYVGANNGASDAGKRTNKSSDDDANSGIDLHVFVLVLLGFVTGHIGGATLTALFLSKSFWHNVKAHRIPDRERALISGLRVELPWKIRLGAGQGFCAATCSSVVWFT